MSTAEGGRLSSPSPIRVLCVDDHPVVQDGIALIIGREPRLQLVATADRAGDALAKFHAFRPDVTLMDLKLPDRSGIEIIEEIRRTHSRARIIALTTYSGDVHASRALRAGAMGYLLKSSLRTELIDTIHAVYGGQRRVSPEVAADISEHITSETLTEREAQVLRALCLGHDNGDIAAKLRISKGTVRGHVRCVYQKLNANDRPHAIAIAFKRGFFAV
jgi:DNA-binding NarL/FixJ family response regulator